jgi:hypothetical protein
MDENLQGKGGLLQQESFDRIPNEIYMVVSDAKDNRHRKFSLWPSLLGNPNRFV